MEQDKPLNGKDMLMLFLYSPGVTGEINEPINGRTRLNKMMFLFEQEQLKDFENNNCQFSLPEFNPYLFGPYSKDLNNDLEFLIAIKLIEEHETDIPISPVTRDEIAFDIDGNIIDLDDTYDSEQIFESCYKLSERGALFVKERLLRRLTDPQLELLHNFKRNINNISLDSLLYYVYTKYPDMTKKSIIKDKYSNR